MENQLIYENKEAQLKIIVQNTAPIDVIELLSGMVWGTNGPRYTKRGIEDKVEKLVKPYFFLLKKSEQIIGLCALSERQLWLNGEWVKSFYVRHFCMNPDFQGQGYSKILIEELKQYVTHRLPKPYIGYAFIEGKNIRSNKVARFIDYPMVRMFDSILFNRIFPKRKIAVRLAKTEEYPQIQTKLKAFYLDYNFVHFTKTFYKKQYYVWEENGEIIAGVQAHAVEWRIHQLSGSWTDNILLKVFPKLPILNRLFNPEYKFLALSSIFYPKGRVDVLPKLFESVLAMREVYTCLLMLDQECPIYADLRALNQWGILQKVQAPISAALVMNVHGLPEEVREASRQKPAYIASFDTL